MNLIQKIKNKLNKNRKNNIKSHNERVIIRVYDKYTNITKYYECTLDVENQFVESRLISNIKEGIKVVDLDEFAKSHILERKIYYSISTANNKFESMMHDSPNFFYMSALYKSKKKDSDEYVQKAYNKYLSLKKILEDRCAQLEISYESDANKDFSNIVDEINRIYEEERFGIGLSNVVSFCHSKEEIIEEMTKEISSGKYDSAKFAYAERYLCNYFSAFIDGLAFFLSLLEKKNLSFEEKKVLSKYAELFTVIPKMMEIIDYLEETVIEIETAKIESKKKKYENNITFMDKIHQLLSMCEGTLYIHATTSLESAKSIIQNGLNTFSTDIDSFCFPCESVDEILRYQYGSDFRKVGDYVIIMGGFPSNYPELEELTPSEAEITMKYMEMRRNIFVPPTNRINAQFILGVIDKKNMDVIFNPKFVDLSEKQMRKK